MPNMCIISEEKEAMSDIVFLDTCIVIDYINGKLNLDDSTIEKSCFNSIVEMEILTGVKNKRDLNTTNKKLNIFKIIDTDQEILTLARNLLETYVLSHNMGIYDAIIASTCLVYDMSLWTYNKKDFRFIDGMVLVDG